LQVTASIYIDIDQLCIGMFIQLEVGWMNHPFPVNSFRIASAQQISTLRDLGLTRVRVILDKCDADVRRALATSGQKEVPTTATESGGAVAAQPASTDASSPEAMRLSLLAEQNRRLLECDRRFAQATREYLAIERTVSELPAQACAQTQKLVAECVSGLLAKDEVAIRLLSEGAGERAALHPVNVMVASLLLGRVLGLQSTALQELGMAALLHDVGKITLPPKYRHPLPTMTPAERAQYEGHVRASAALARSMGLPDAAVIAIAQHHEMADGSGFPKRLCGSDLGRASQMLALVNHYDRLCNPVREADALTPHEALAMIFARRKACFDETVLGAFIRMMGVYPPGSVVQLANDRYALVVSVNSNRPLRPKVIVHDPQVPKEEALILDLEAEPELGIRRSLRPSQLPREALDYLSPRKKICYFFERAVALEEVAGQEEAMQ